MNSMTDKVLVLDADGFQTDLRARDEASPSASAPAKAAVRPPWGGARRGAGRKSTGRQPVLLRLTPRTLANLRTAARQSGKTLSDLAEERLARS